MIKIKLTLIIGALCLFGQSTLAADLVAGQKKSEACAACHGANGISSNPAWPNLAGQQKMYLVKQMRAFRDGSRKDPWMSSMAEKLSDEDMENLATFYNGLPIRDAYQ